MNSFKKEDAYSNLERVNGWISNCDNKAGILIAVIGLIIAFTTEVFDSVAFLKKIASDCAMATTGNITLLIFQLIFLCVYLTATIFAVYHVVKVLIPRLKNDIYKGEMLERKSILFYGTISANKDYESFSKEVNEISEENLINDINSQVYINSCICADKFKHFKKSIKWVIISSICVFVLLILIRLI